MLQQGAFPLVIIPFFISCKFLSLFLTPQECPCFCHQSNVPCCEVPLSTSCHRLACHIQQDPRQPAQVLCLPCLLYHIRLRLSLQNGQAFYMEPTLACIAVPLFLSVWIPPVFTPWLSTAKGGRALWFLIASVQSLSGLYLPLKSVRIHRILTGRSTRQHMSGFQASRLNKSVSSCKHELQL